MRIALATANSKTLRQSRSICGCRGCPALAKPRHLYAAGRLGVAASCKRSYASTSENSNNHARKPSMRLPFVFALVAAAFAAGLAGARLAPSAEAQSDAPLTPQIINII